MWCHFAHWCEGNQLIFLHGSIHLVLSSLLKRLFLSILLSEHSWWKIKCLQMQCLFFDFRVYRINSHFSWLCPPSFNYYSSVGIFFCYLRIFVHANNLLWLFWSNSTLTFLLQLFSYICNIFSLQLFMLFYFKSTESTQCYLYVFRYQSIESHREVTSLKKTDSSTASSHNCQYLFSFGWDFMTTFYLPHPYWDFVVIYLTLILCTQGQPLLLQVCKDTTLSGKRCFAEAVLHNLSPLLWWSLSLGENGGYISAYQHSRNLCKLSSYGLLY